MQTSDTPKPAIQIDLIEACAHASHSGPQWGHESDDLDVTLLRWERGRRIEPHVNDEVDVVWIVTEGTGVARVDEIEHELRAGVALLIPKGAARAVSCTGEALCYLSVHRRRRGLMPSFR